MASTTAAVRRETIPDNRILGEYEAGSSTRYRLRATMPVFVVLVQGANNIEFKVRAPYRETPGYPLAGVPRLYSRRATASGSLQVSSLLHTRGQGAPKVNTQTRPAGLDHLRALGSPTVIPPSTTPPVIPPVTPPVTPTSTPRNLRYVERRNRPQRN